MNQNQINRKEMHDAVLEYLDMNAQKWASIPKVGEFKNELDQINSQIEQAQEAQENAQVSIGKNKSQLKRQIALKADILNDILETYALLAEDAELESKMSDSFTKLYELRNKDFATKIKQIVGEAENHRETLTAEYGMTDEQVEDIKTGLTNFTRLDKQPDAYRIASVQATADLDALFKQAGEILSSKLDKVMKIFKRRDPRFYNGYLAARVVIDN